MVSSPFSPMDNFQDCYESHLIIVVAQKVYLFECVNY